MHLLAIGDNTNKLVWVGNSISEMFGNELRKRGLEALEMLKSEDGIRKVLACCDTCPEKMRKWRRSLT